MVENDSVPATAPSGCMIEALCGSWRVGDYGLSMCSWSKASTRWRTTTTIVIAKSSQHVVIDILKLDVVLLDGLQGKHDPLAREGHVHQARCVAADGPGAARAVAGRRSAVPALRARATVNRRQPFRNCLKPL